jgi:hypothetical protein
MQLPVIVQILVIFSAIVLATTRKAHLGLAAALGGVVFALWRGLGPAATAAAVGRELFRADTLLIMLLMTAIMAFSTAMKKAGAMDAFSAALRAVTPSPCIAMAVAPLLIGTLPMPGGAIMSAPLVESMDPEKRHGGDVLSAVNYWFRHSLELAWPLYPAFILTSSLSGIEAGRLILLNAYALPLLFILGLLFVAPRGAGDGATAAHAGEAAARPSLGRRLAAFAHGVGPLAVVLGSYIALDALWRGAGSMLGLGAQAAALFGRYAPILAGLALGSEFLARRAGGWACFKGSVNAATFKLIAVIAGIRVFSALLDGAGAAQAAAAELATAGIPLLAAVALLPFIAGLVTGVGFGYVGLAFPIILGMLPEGGAIPREAGVVFAGAFGYAGMMLSPLHVCMVVSAEHFGTGLAATIRRFALPLALFVLVASAYAYGLGLVLA